MRSCKKARNGATPVPGPTMMIGVSPGYGQGTVHPVGGALQVLEQVAHVQVRRNGRTVVLSPS